jgi:hypothetical protein
MLYSAQNGFIFPDQGMARAIPGPSPLVLLIDIPPYFITKRSVIEFVYGSSGS